MFTKRHGQELAEIRALFNELGQHAQEGLERLKRIRETHDRLTERPSRPVARPTETAAPPSEGPSVEPASPGRKRRGGPREALRRFVFGPEIDLAPSGAEPDAAQRLAQAPEDRAPGTPTADDNGAEPLLAFVHIPKTAGGTVVSMFTAVYSRQDVRDAGNYLRNPERTVKTVTSPRKLRVRVLAGHVPYGVYQKSLASDTRYMTFLREPIDRVLSHYFRHVFAKDPRVDRAVRRPNRVRNPIDPEEGQRVGLDLLDEALVERRLTALSNLATRFLCNDPSPSGDLPASALDDAKANLRRFAFVGIQERFDESLVLLQRMLGLGSLPNQDQHVRHVSIDGSRPTVEELPDEKRHLIEEYNRLDAELYTFGLGLFEEAVAAAGEDFATDVEAVRGALAAGRPGERGQAGDEGRPAVAVRGG